MAIHMRTKADSKIIILVAYYIIVTVDIKISYSLLYFFMSSCAITYWLLFFCNAWAIGWLTVAVPPANQIRAPFRLQLLEAQLRNPSTESRERGLSAPSSHFPEMGLNGQYGFPLFQKGSYTWFPHLSMDYMINYKWFSFEGLRRRKIKYWMLSLWHFEPFFPLPGIHLCLN